MSKRLTILDIVARKGGKKIAALTASSAPMASILDKHVDMLLVGDSLGMVVYGMDSTLEVTLPMMIAHGKAVVRATSHALVVVDMPFGSYQLSKEKACQAAMEILAQTGCDAVKIEGGAVMAETVHYLVDRGVPVMGHIGLMPQYMHTMGGFRYQGKSEAQAKQLLEDAIAISQARAFAVVLEAIPEALAQDVTQQITAPTIGIGASGACDGQILVTEDMAGLFTDFTPKFVKRYGNMAELLDNAVAHYVEEVQQHHFPEPKHCT